MAAIEKFESPFGLIELTDEREKHILNFHPEVKKYRKSFSKIIDLLLNNNLQDGYTL